MASTIELLRLLCQIPCVCSPGYNPCPSCLVVRAQLVAHLRNNLKMPPPARVSPPCELFLGRGVINHGNRMYVTKPIRSRLGLKRGDSIDFFEIEGKIVARFGITAVDKAMINK